MANSTIVVQPKTPREGTYIFLAQNLSCLNIVYKMLWIKMQCRTHVSFIRSTQPNLEDSSKLVCKQILSECCSYAMFGVDRCIYRPQNSFIRLFFFFFLKVLINSSYDSKLAKSSCKDSSYLLKKEKEIRNKVSS